jgi:spore germination protein YaaH
MLQGVLGGAAALSGADQLSRGYSPTPTRAAGAWPIVLFWLESGDPASLASLQQHVNLITHLSPTWFSMRDDLSIVGDVDPLVVQFAARHQLALHPLIHNDQYDASVAERILATPQQRAMAAQQIANLVLQHNFDGINMDFEGTFGAAIELYADLIQRLAARLRPAGKWVTVDVVPHLGPTAPHPINAWSAPYDYVHLGAACDAVVLMAYDYSVQQPGPISPLWWVRQVIAFARTKIAPQKIVVGFPSYGREWIQAHGTTSMSSVTLVEAQQWLTWTGAPLRRPARDATPRFTWRGTDGTHIVHYDDRTSLTAKLQLVDADLGGVAFWRLGLEEPHQWDVLNTWVTRRVGQ